MLLKATTLRARRLPAVFGLIALIAGCGSESLAPPLGGGIDNDETPGALLPPEREVVSTQFLGVAPGVTDEFIYVANPSIDSVSRIAIRKPHQIELIRTGLEPSLIKTTPEYVLVLNNGDHTVSRIRAATHEVVNYPIPKDINDIAFHDLGYGVGYVNRDKLDAKIISDGTRALDVISIIDIDGGSVISRALGFAPKTIVFATTAANKPLALVATDARGTLLHLDTAVSTPIPFTTSTFSTLEEALLSRDGTWALFRERDRPGIRAVEIAGGAAETLAGDAIATDVDLSPDGQTLFVSDRAAGYRLRTYAIWPTDITLTRTLTATQPYAQTELTPDGKTAVLFSTSDSVSAAGIYDIDGDLLSDIPLILPVAAVLPAPDSRSALIIHRATSEKGFFSGPTLSMLNLETGEAPAVELDGTLEAIDFSPDGDYAFVTTVEPDYLVVFSLRNGLHAAQPLSEKPLFMRALPVAGGEAFVTQSHDAGRILFLQVTDVVSSLQYMIEILTGYLLGTLAE